MTQERTEFISKTKEKLDVLDAKIVEIEAKANRMSGQAQRELQDTIERLREAKKQADDRLRELRQAAKPAWQDMRQGVEQAWQTLSESVKSAGERLQ
ncbi:MAG: hypothetical protein R3192_14480 [Woeseiaceae bacterium]|nr:hypothetical protein [Woeseiaceae bacterium]